MLKGIREAFSPRLVPLREVDAVRTSSQSYAEVSIGFFLTGTGLLCPKPCTHCGHTKYQCDWM